MAKTTKKETDSTTKSTQTTKPAAKAKTATKASETPKSTTRHPSEVHRKDASRPAESKKAAPVAKKSTERAPEPKKTEKLPAAKVSEITTPRIRKTPPRVNNVTVEPAPLHPGSVNPSPEQIAQRAYFLYIDRGGYHGCDVDDWLEAERQMTGTHA